MPLAAPNANEYIEAQLDLCIASIENELNADALSFTGPLFGGVDDIIRLAVEQKHDKQSNRRKLAVILTTTGGYIEVVQRIVDTLRKHYSLVDFVVPNYAYSAGTVLVMSGDAIQMDYYSRLGPIDPQLDSKTGHQVSALGYLERYQELLDKANHGKISMPEMQILLQFDQGELYQFDQARQLSIALLKEWLVKYKFKDWSKTRTRQKKVTKQMKISTATKVAKILNDTKKWHSHGYGLSKDVLERDIGVLIDDFGQNLTLSNCIRQYHDLLTDYMGRRGQAGVVHHAGHYRPFMDR
jgi:hypothetical protein